MSEVRYMVRFGSGNPATYTGLSPTFTEFFNSAGAATTAPGISEISGSGMYSFTYEPTGFIGFLIDGTASMAAEIRYVAGVLDQNDRNFELGVTFAAFGVTFAGQNVSMMAMGTTLFGMGVTLGGIGVSLDAIGVTLTGIGNSVAAFDLGGMGTSIIAIGDTLFGVGVTLVGIGNTVSALDVAGMGVTLVAGFSLVGAATDLFGDSSANPTTLFGFMRRIQEFNEGNSDYNKGTGVWDIMSRGSSFALASKTITNSATLVAKT